MSAFPPTRDDHRSERRAQTDDPAGRSRGGSDDRDGLQGSPGALRQARAPVGGDGHGPGEDLAWKLSPVALRQEVLSLRERADLLDVIHDCVIVRNLAGRILLWNRAAAETYGYDGEHAQGKNYDLLLRPRYEVPLAEVHMKLLQGDQWEGRIHHRTADDREVVSYSRWRLWRGNDSLPLGILEINRDITDQVEAESRAESERKRLSALLNLLPAYVVIKDRDCRIAFANREFCRIFGQPGDRPCHEVQFGRGDRCPRCHVAEILDSGTGQHWETHQTDGRVYQVWGYPFDDADGQSLVLELGVDVTPLRQAQELVAEISEHERRNIGLELHDSVGQRLTGLAFLVQGLQSSVAETGSGLAHLAERVVDISQQLTAQIRAMAHGLDPVALEDQGLAEGLRDLSETITTIWEIPCSFSCDCEGGIRGNTALQLYRIAQEACSNAARHASCTRIDISLTCQGNYVLIRVDDDGEGLPDPSKIDRGMGVRTMQYRAETLAGELTLEARPGGGTCVTCRVPSPPDAEADNA
jgi:PAS domain S-box-containing protein